MITTQFPWFNNLHGWWKNNPVYNLVYSSADPTQDFGGQAAALFKIGACQPQALSARLAAHAVPSSSAISSFCPSSAPTHSSTHPTVPDPPSPGPASSAFPSFGHPASYFPPDTFKSDVPLLSPLDGLQPSLPPLTISNTSHFLPPSSHVSSLSSASSHGPVSSLSPLSSLPPVSSPAPSTSFPSGTSFPPESPLLPRSSFPPRSPLLPTSPFSPTSPLFSPSLHSHPVLPPTLSGCPSVVTQDKEKGQDDLVNPFGFDSIFRFDEDNDDNDDLYRLRSGPTVPTAQQPTMPNTQQPTPPATQWRVICLNDDLPPLHQPMPWQTSVPHNPALHVAVAHHTTLCHAYFCSTPLQLLESHQTQAQTWQHQISLPTLTSRPLQSGTCHYRRFLTHFSLTLQMKKVICQHQQLNQRQHLLAPPVPQAHENVVVRRRLISCTTMSWLCHRKSSAKCSPPRRTTRLTNVHDTS